MKGVLIAGQLAYPPLRNTNLHFTVNVDGVSLVIFSMYVSLLQSKSVRHWARIGSNIKPHSRAVVFLPRKVKTTFVERKQV